VLGRLDDILTEQTGVSLADVIEASGLDGGDPEGEAMAAEPSPMDAGVVDGGMVPYGADMPTQAMPTSRRQRITLR